MLQCGTDGQRTTEDRATQRQFFTLLPKMCIFTLVGVKIPKLPKALRACEWFECRTRFECSLPNQALAGGDNVTSYF